MKTYNFYIDSKHTVWIRSYHSIEAKSEEEAKEKLRLFNCDYMRVIKDYMGIPEKKEENKVKSVNQEIYRQLRTKLDSSMKEYREKNPINLDFKLFDSHEEENNFPISLLNTVENCYERYLFFLKNQNIFYNNK